MGFLGMILVLGRMRSQWPEPLGAMVREGRAAVEPVASVHELAARLVAGGVRAVMLDAEVMGKKDWAAVEVIQKKAGVTMIVLPLNKGAQARVNGAAVVGVLAWDEGMAAIEGNREVKTEKDEAAKIPAAAGSAAAEDAAARYDEAGLHPVVSEEELQALLGVEE